MSVETAGSFPSRAFQTYDPRLEPIAAKVVAEQRLSADDGLALYRSNDVLAVGWLANHVRERLHGDVTYFNVNRHINPTNVCVAACKLCAFGRKKGDPAGYTMALEEAWETAASGYSEAVTEFHIVGGLHPDLPLEFFLDLVQGLKKRFPKVHIKAFTMVEIAFLARRAKLSIEETLLKLREAGVDSMPGGGAEIFAARVRSIICDHKIDGDEWLETARTAHKLGFKSNATMLYGHIENDSDRVDHLLKLRALQDETGGFQTFIPLAFHPENTPLDHLPVTTGLTDIRQIAVSRLLARQLSAHQGLLADDDAQDRADRAALRRRRPRRHRDRREDLPRRRRHNSARPHAQRTLPPHHRSRPHPRGARHALPSRDAHRGELYGCGVEALRPPCAIILFVISQKTRD